MVYITAPQESTRRGSPQGVNCEESPRRFDKNLVLIGLTKSG